MVERAHNTNKPLWKKMAKICAYITAVLLALVVVAIGYLDSGSGHKKIASMVEDSLKTAESSIAIGEIEGSIFSDLQISSVTLSDRQGIWLEIQDIKATWSPASIFASTLHVSEISANLVDLKRTPETPEEKSEPEDQTPFTLTLPELPIDIVIENFSASKIIIGETFANVSSNFKLSGALKLTEADGITIKTNLVNSESNQDKIHIDVSYPREGSSLDVDMTLSAPKDGFFISLAGLDVAKDIVAEINGQGPINDWSGNIDVLLGEKKISHTDVGFKDAELDLLSEIIIENFLPTEFADIGSKPTFFKLNMKPSSSKDKWDIITAINNHFMNIDAIGALNLNQPEIFDQLNLTLALTDVSPLQPIIAPAYVTPFNMNGVLTSISSRPQLHVTFDDFSAGTIDQIEARLAGEIKAELAAQTIKITSKGKIISLSGSSVEAIEGLVEPGFIWALDGSFDQNSSLASLKQFILGNRFMEIGAEATFANTTGAAAVNLGVTVADLSNISRAMDVDVGLKGNAKLTLSGARANNDAPLKADIELNTDNMTLENALISELIGPAQKLKVDIEQSSEGTLRVRDLALNADHINFVAESEISPEQQIRDAIFNLEFEKLEQIKNLEGMSLTGNIKITGSLSGSLKNPSLKAETGFNALDIQGLSLSDLTAKLVADNILGDVAATLESKSESTFGLFILNAKLAKENETFNLPDLNLSLGPYQATGNISLQPEHPALGEIIIQTNERELDSVNSGNIDASITLSDENATQKIILNANLENILLSLNEADLVSLKSGEISADMLLLENNPRVKLTAIINELMHPQFQIADAQISADQIKEGFAYTAIANGTNSMPYQIELTGDFKVDQQNIQTLTASMNGSIGDTPISFEHEDGIIMADDNIAVSPFILGLGDGTISGSAEVISNTVHANIEADNADLAPIRVLLQEFPLTGHLNGTLDLNKSLDSFLTDFNLNLTDIEFPDQSSIYAESMNFAVTGKVTELSSDITGTMSLDESFSAIFDAKIPLKIDPATFTAHLDEQAILEGHINWKGEVASIWPVVNQPDHDLSGDLQTTLTIGGTISKPDIDGELTLSSGRYEHMQSGFVAGNIDMAATILDRNLKLDHFSANDGEDGTMAATADIRVDQDLDYNAQVNLSLAGAKLVRQPELSITTSSELIFIKNSEQSSLKGDINIENADIGAINAGGPAIPTLDVTEINSDGIVAKNGKQDEELKPVDLDLNLRAPRKLFIRSFGMDSEWQADLKITGTSEEPIIGGTASQIRGFFEFSGKRFNLTRGSFSFPGNSSNDPIIEILAEHQLPDMTATIRIFGPASNPSIKMSSTPYLPENEVMARILFGTSVAQLTTVEAVQLAAAIHSLSNGGGQGLMGGIRSAIGVDRLSIDNDASREYGTTITGGKYLTDNVYVEVSTAPATGQTATSVEVGLSRNLSLVTRRTLDNDNNLSIKWFWDY